MIKVVHVLTDMKVGGAGRWLLNLLKSTDRSKLDVVVALPEGSMMIRPVEQLGFRVREIAGMADKSLDLSTLGALKRIFGEEKPDIVHTHASLSARIAARLAGTGAVVNTKHCIDPIRGGMKARLGSFVNARLSDRIIAVSEAVGSNIRASGIPGKLVEVVYSGVDDIPELSAAERKAVREELGIGENELVVGMVARLAAVKGHEYFLEAAAAAAPQLEHVKFLIAGGGPREKELKGLAAAYHLEDKVIFTGYVEDIEKIYNIIDINVISSVSEALCLSLIEGMSLGKPSIGTDTGGIPEVVRDGQNGLLVPPADAEALTGAILRLAKDRALREQMGRSGKELMNRLFRAELMGERVERLYRELLKR